uniref:TSA: Wollemia nobilis Ref_Wollemi_Transcript_21746_2457 transcribed RNA sequence n=1 Tax=Wollemia nobilis TaxID=56998 RepID=A0A0C9S566_9CONI
MTEPEAAYTVASDNEAASDDAEPTIPFVETAIGIDFGTFQCRLAAWKDSKVELLHNLEGHRMMPSFVLFKGDTPSSGISLETSYNQQELLSGSAVFNVKRLVGRMDTDPVVHDSKNLPFMVETLDIGVRPFIASLNNGVWRSTTPEEVLAILLVELKAMAEVQLGRAVRTVVLTMPVAFSRFQQTRIERACAMAGLHVLRLMPEPTAVALLYAQQQQMASQGNLGSGSEKIAVIFNMGAGYCDVAVTATAGGVSQIKALAGDVVGGEDILQNVMRYVAPDINPLSVGKSGDAVKVAAMLRIAVQNAIHTLSSHNSASVEVDLGNGMKLSKIIRRDEFEHINEEVFLKCESLIMQCLHDSQIDVGNIEDVILVGGCSHIPKIRSLLMSICKGKTIYEGMKPLEAAVCGAALEGAIASGISDPNLDLLTIQATPLSLGVKVDGTDIVPVVHRNATIPARRDAFFTTIHDNQSEALILVYEGEGKKAEDNHLLGFFKMSGIPPAPKGIPIINVCMDVDASNVLRVFAGVTMPEAESPVVRFVEVRMPTVDDGHGWCIEALLKKYGSSLDICLAQKRPQK